MTCTSIAFGSSQVLASSVGTHPTRGIWIAPLILGETDFTLQLISTYRFSHFFYRSQLLSAPTFRSVQMLPNSFVNEALSTDS